MLWQSAATSAMVLTLSRMRRKRSSCKYSGSARPRGAKDVLGGSRKASFSIPVLSSLGSMSDYRSFVDISVFVNRTGHSHKAVRSCFNCHCACSDVSHNVHSLASISFVSVNMRFLSLLPIYWSLNILTAHGLKGSVCSQSMCLNATYVAGSLTCK